MADASDIEYVRKNTGTVSDAAYTDGYIGGLIDDTGVTASIVTLWREKAAAASAFFNVSEAGSSHSAGDLFKHAEAMLKRWEGELDVEVVDVTERPRLKKIVRT